MVKAIINTTVYDYEHFIQGAYVLFDKQIFEVGKMKGFINHDYEIINGENHLVLPGHILAHTHIYSAFARGLSVPYNPKNFQEILDQLWWKLDSHIDNDISFSSGIVYAVDCVKNGITTLIDHHASGIDIYGSLSSLKHAVVDTVGLRGCFCFETSDRYDIRLCIRENSEFAQNNQTSHARGLFGLHASMSLSEETLKAVKTAKNQIPIHIHVAESIDDFNHTETQYHESVVSRLYRHGLLSEGALLIHAVHISEADMDIIKSSKASIVVNVNSNLNNAVGLPNIPLMLNKGIPVLIGNDGLGASVANEYQSIYYLMHHFKKSPTGFSLGDLLQMINHTYAYASQLFKVKLGRIEAGYEADLQIVPYLPPTPLNADNIFGHLFFGLFNAYKPRNVYCSGQPIVKDYQVDNNLSHLYASSENQAEILWNRIKQEEKL